MTLRGSARRWLAVALATLTALLLASASAVSATPIVQGLGAQIRARAFNIMGSMLTRPVASQFPCVRSGSTTHGRRRSRAGLSCGTC